MKTEHLDQLIRIYNTLLAVGTKGEDTVIMGQCLGALRELITMLQEDNSQVSMDDM